MNTQLLILSFFALATLLLVPSTTTTAQKFLQIERYGSAKTKKIFSGEEITYRLKGDDTWHTRVVEDYNIDQGMIITVDRYIKVDEISTLRFERNWPRAFGRQFFWFGLGWSFYGVLGTSFDGNPNTHYRWADAGVTGTSWAMSLLLPKLFRYKKVRMGERRRLRLVDIDFRP